MCAETITALLRRQPDLKVYALGGPKMEAAGAELIEHTTQHGTMFLSVLGHVWSHHKRLRRLRRWLDEHPIDVLIPVDSPAANWSICRVFRRARPSSKIVHLVAPQVWAWASWRVRRLRRLTDHVLCLLPFEPQWLMDRGVKATFVGHPIFDPAIQKPPEPAEGLPGGHPRLALLPGSRRAEIRRNWPTMLETFVRLRQTTPQLVGAVAALDAGGEQLLRRITQQSGWPEGLTVTTGRTDAVLDWCDAALLASGTVSLQVASRLKPMVIMYNMHRLTALLASLLVRTHTFTLPNLVAEWAGLGRAVPELVPHFGKVEPVVRQTRAILTDEAASTRQKKILAEIAARFGDRRFSEEATSSIEQTLRQSKRDETLSKR